MGSNLVQAWWGEPESYHVYTYDSDSDQFVGTSEVIRNSSASSDHRVENPDVWVWSSYVEIGKLYGWQPMGTSLKYIGEKLIRENPQVGCVNDYVPINYDYAFKKLVYAEDAAAWANALEKALADIEAGDFKYDLRWQYVSVQRWQKYEVEGSPIIENAFNEKEVQEFKDFIHFLRQGQFKFAIYQSVWD